MRSVLLFADDELQPAGGFERPTGLPPAEVRRTRHGPKRVGVLRSHLVDGIGIFRRYLASYSAGKAAVDQLVKVAANELGSLRVRVNSVQPGLTRTPTTRDVRQSRHARRIREAVSELPPR